MEGSMVGSTEWSGRRVAGPGAEMHGLRIMPNIRTPAHLSRNANLPTISGIIDPIGLGQAAQRNPTSSTFFPSINMNPNTVRARLSLSFKGETRALDAVIDLDAHSGGPGEAPDFHRLLAQAAGIDPYSYLYESLESHEIEFSDATGMAARSCRDGGFDWAQFAQDAREERDWQAVRAAAEPLLAARDLDADPALKAALLAVYRAGAAG